MSLREKVAWLILAALAVVGVVVACNDPNAAGSLKSSAQLVYICQSYPCRAAQILQVSDKYGNPGFGVPEYGGPWAAGDCGLRDFGTDPQRFLHGKPAFTICYESPQAYDRQHPTAGVLDCVAPARWDWPGGIDVCVTGGWVTKVRL